MKTLRSFLTLLLLCSLPGLLRAEPVAVSPAPAWKLEDVNGHPVSSDQFKGKVIVVDFWATWCVPCRMEIPGYIALQKKYAKDGLVIVGMSCDQGKNATQAVKNYMKQAGINYQIVMADEDVQAAFGGMDAIPTTFIIDRTGKIRERKVGVVGEAEYEATILKYLK